MFLIYEILQKLILLFLQIFSFSIPSQKFKRFLQLRDPKNFENSIQTVEEKFNKLKINNQDLQIFWFHFASAGEIEQAIPIAMKISEKINVSFFVTYFSPSAEPFLKNFPNLLIATGLPLDIRNSYEKLLTHLPITRIFFVRYDFWPSLFFICRKHLLEINLISATASKTKQGITSVFNKIWGEVFYKKFSNIFVVNSDDIDYFSLFLDKSNVFFAGDAKWARAYERAKQSSYNIGDSNLKLFLKFCRKTQEKRKIKNLVFGSPHAEEHHLALQCSLIKEKFFLVYVPHEVGEKNCLKIFKEFESQKVNVILYSSLMKIMNEENSEDFTNYEVVIVDKIGVLAELYSIADAAIIGGGFDGQVHNVLEAVAHGTPVLIGGEYSRAYEAKQIIEAGAGFSFKTSNELFQFLQQWANFENQKRLDSNHPKVCLDFAKSKSLELFKSIPNTSEIILDVLLSHKKGKSQN